MYLGHVLITQSPAGVGIEECKKTTVARSGREMPGCFSERQGLSTFFACLQKLDSHP